MDTGRQRGKHMKLSLTKFLLHVSTKQEIQEKDSVAMGFGMKRTHKKIFKPKKYEKMLTSTHKIII